MVVTSISSALQKHINNTPDWVCWVAQNADCQWRGYDNMPVIGLIPSGVSDDHQMYEDWLYDVEHGATEIQSIPLFQDKPNPNWQKTCKRVRRIIKR